MDYLLLIQRCKRKDRAAEKQLFMQLAPVLLSDCRRYATDDSTAQEYLQEVMIKIFDKLDCFSGDKDSSFIGWSRVVCRNHIFSLMRKDKNSGRIVPIDQVHIDSTTSGEADALYSEEDIILAMQQLPSGYRQIFNLYAVEGYSHTEIGAELNISASTSRSQYMRARSKLRHLLTLINNKRNAWNGREAL